jgi:hypothetical protein
MKLQENNSYRFSFSIYKLIHAFDIIKGFNCSYVPVILNVVILNKEVVKFIV